MVTPTLILSFGLKSLSFEVFRHHAGAGASDVTIYERILRVRQLREELLQ